MFSAFYPAINYNALRYSEIVRRSIDGMLIELAMLKPKPMTRILKGCL